MEDRPGGGGWGSCAESADLQSKGNPQLSTSQSTTLLGTGSLGAWTSSAEAGS